MPKGYVIALVTIRDPDRYKEYASQTQASLDPFGVRFIVRGGPSERLEGEWDAQRTVVIEFPSVEQAKAWYASDDYRRIAPIRQGASTGDFAVVEGVA